MRMSTQLIDRIRSIVDDGSVSRSGLARAAGLHANSLRDLDSPSWNPTAETLRKLEQWLEHGSDVSPMASAEEIIAEARNGRMMKTVKMKAIWSFQRKWPPPMPSISWRRMAAA
jgi:3,4-dihydroxy 2-butanone 4-phosphate synthase/GTP cyclohydrolase II